MYKATNIKWETDGCEVDLPSEINIPKRFIDKDGVDEEAVSDWLSYTFEYLHDGFEIVDECKTLFNKICKPIPTYALTNEIGLDTETSYIYIKFGNERELSDCKRISQKFTLQQSRICFVRRAHVHTSAEYPRTTYIIIRWY